MTKPIFKDSENGKRLRKGASIWMEGFCVHGKLSGVYFRVHPMNDGSLKVGCHHDKHDEQMSVFNEGEITQIQRDLTYIAQGDEQFSYFIRGGKRRSCYAEGVVQRVATGEAA